MFTVTSTSTRPSTSVAWWTDEPSLATEAATMQSLNDNPLLLSTQTTESPDGLTQTKIYNFDSYADYQSWVGALLTADASIFQKRNDYIISNGLSLTIEEVYENGNRVIEKQL